MRESTRLCSMWRIIRCFCEIFASQLTAVPNFWLVLSITIALVDTPSFSSFSVYRVNQLLFSLLIFWRIGKPVQVAFSLVVASAGCEFLLGRKLQGFSHFMLDATRCVYRFRT